MKSEKNYLLQNFEFIKKSNMFLKLNKENNLNLKVIFFKRDIIHEINWQYSFQDINNKLHTFQIECNEKVCTNETDLTNKKVNVKYLGSDDIYDENNLNETINLFDLKLNYESASKLFDNLIGDKTINTEICALTNHKDLGLNWNITKISTTFDVINAKISNDGIILNHSIQNIMKFGDFIKGERKL